jgi:ABC-type transport system substrate-binding protein
VAKRAKLLQEAEAMVIAEVPLIPLFQQNKDYLIVNALKGYYPNTLDVHPWKYVYRDNSGTTRTPVWQLVSARFKKG